jgi:hypothetical protein
MFHNKVNSVYNYMARAKYKSNVTGMAQAHMFSTGYFTKFLTKSLMEHK